MRMIKFFQKRQSGFLYEMIFGWIEISNIFLQKRYVRINGSTQMWHLAQKNWMGTGIIFIISIAKGSVRAIKLTKKKSRVHKTKIISLFRRCFIPKSEVNINTHIVSLLVSDFGKWRGGIFFSNLYLSLILY